jgi:hypothetical protein
LLGTAAHDALGTGAVGTMVKAKELILRFKKAIQKMLEVKM